MIRIERVAPPGFTARNIRTYVPAQYKDSQPAPLLVLFDGQNVFDDAPSFSGGWHVHKAVSKLAKTRPHPIVVGVDHGNADRLTELSPYPLQGQAGRAEAFVGWLADDLLPQLRQRYALINGAVGVLVGGSSLGGLAAMYAHYQYPQVFGGALAMSPSFWVGGGRLFDFVDSKRKPWVSKVYLDAGEHEARGTVKQQIARMETTLLSKGLASDHLKAVVDPKGHHNELAWRRRILPALRWFYPDRRKPSGR